jgi:hypothetical protein
VLVFYSPRDPGAAAITAPACIAAGAAATLTAGSGRRAGPRKTRARRRCKLVVAVLVVEAAAVAEQGRRDGQSADKAEVERESSRPVPDSPTPSPLIAVRTNAIRLAVFAPEV